MWPYKPSCGIICHNQEGKAALRDIVEEVVLPNVGKLAVIRRDSGQDRLGCYQKPGSEIGGCEPGYPGVF